MNIKPFLQVAKPGIVLGNLISVAGGFLLASQGNIDLLPFLATMLSVSLVVGSGCVFNNYIDRDIDLKMERTKNRVLVQGVISPAVALFYATVLLILGITTLALATNALAVWLVIIGFVIYVGAYSLYLKRNSVYGTLIGSLSGAAPPVVGYCAVTNQFDGGALILLLIFSLWQMPHSYAIAIFRYNDYLSASIPVLPVHRGINIAKRHIVVYIIAFTLAAMLLTVFGYTGYSYCVVTTILGGWWLWLALSGYHTKENRVWARHLFAFSILTITSLSIMMSIGPYY